MAVNLDEETLEYLLNKATSTLNREEDWEYIMGFCDKVKTDLEGSQVSTRLLAHKIQSPQEKEALQALTVLEACVKNCGEIFQKELGKYRFLNELIKVVSPKYLGTKTSDKVQKRVIALLYTWSVALTDQVKIRDAYQMLKKQGIVTEDPQYDVSLITNVPKRDDRDTLFKDEDKKKQLERLLRSTKPEDLQAANRLIKNVVQEDEAKMEKIRKRTSTLEEVSNNVRLLSEMLAHFNPDDTTISDMQAMKELYDGCHKLRPTLFRLASDTDDDEQALMDILRANDDVSRVMQSFEKLVNPKLTSITDRKADGAAEPDRSTEQQSAKTDQNHRKSLNKSSNMSDLVGLSLTSPAQGKPSNSSDPFGNFAAFDAKPTTDTSNGLDDNLLTFPQSSASIPAESSSNDVGSLFLLDDLVSALPTNQQPNFPSASAVPTTAATQVSFPAQPSLVPAVAIPKLPSPPQQKPQLFSDLGDMSRNLMEQSLGRKLQEKFPDPKPKPTLNDLFKPPVTDPAPQAPESSQLVDLAMPLVPKDTEPAPLAPSASIPPDFSLNDVIVALESIRPSSFTPITVYDSNGIRIMMHFAKDHASPARTDTLVAVVSMISTRTNPVQNILFQAAAPKVMKVKLQTPSSTDLPAFNPIFSSPPLTQVMIVANPSKKEVKIRYKLDYKIDHETNIEHGGVITGFPPCEKWGKL